MNEPHARDLFLEFHQGSLPVAQAAELREFLASNAAIAREFAEFAATLNALDTMSLPSPSPRLRANVYAAIASEKIVNAEKEITPAQHQPPAKAGPRRWWIAQAFAAGALVALGYFAGVQKTSLEQPAQPDAGASPATQRELADLRRQVDSMSQLVSYSLLQQQQRPTNDRLKSVLASAQVENPNEKVIGELIGSLNLDPSANVRLTALEALYPHAGREAVRAGVLASLPREQSPLVQVAMIDFLVAARESGATSALDRISRADTTDRSVRDAARRALTQL